MSQTRERIDRQLRDLSDTQKDVVAAVQASTRVHLAAEAVREVRDTQRHDELMASQQAVAGAVSRMGDALVAEMRQVALLLLEQTAQLKRIADTLETPRATEARELRGMASRHVRAGNLPAARQLLTESLALDGTEHATYLMLGFLEYKSGEHDAAVETLLGGVKYASGKVDTSPPQNARAYTLHMAARIRDEQQRHREAAQLLMQAMDAERAHPDRYWWELASYLARAGEYGEALGALACMQDEGFNEASRSGLFNPIRPALAEMRRSREAAQREKLRRIESALEEEIQRARPLVTTLRKLRLRYARRSQPLEEEACLPGMEEALSAVRTRLEDADVLLSGDTADLGQSAINTSRYAKYQEGIDELRVLLRARRKKRLKRAAIAVPLVLLSLLQLNAWRVEAERKRFEAALDQRFYVAPMTGYEMGAELAGLLYAQDRARGLGEEEREAARFAQAVAVMGPFNPATMPKWMSFDILTGFYGELRRLTEGDDDHHLKDYLEKVRLEHFGMRHEASGTVSKAREDTTRAMFDERRTLVLMRHMWADYASQDDTSPEESAAYQPLINRATEMIDSFVRDEAFAPPS